MCRLLSFPGKKQPREVEELQARKTLNALCITTYTTYSLCGAAANAANSSDDDRLASSPTMTAGYAATIFLLLYVFQAYRSIERLRGLG